MPRATIRSGMSTNEVAAGREERSADYIERRRGSEICLPDQTYANGLEKLLIF
jgi:hypothetical protein